MALNVSGLLSEPVLAQATVVTYATHYFTSEEEFLGFIKQENHSIDCLILEGHPQLQNVLDRLTQQAILFPAIFLKSEGQTENWSYHGATVDLSVTELGGIGAAIDRAIAQFIQLSPVRQSPVPEIPKSLVAQQLRLSEKLKERLGYLGVYYKRDPQNFLRHMTKIEREDLLRHLKAEYREIVLTYFSDTAGLNDRLDNFVNIAFFADVSVAQIVEIHMELMDEFSKQLKLEGRNDEILQDYRLTLIDAIAHLCEMYRRSVPRESGVHDKQP